MHLTSVVRCEKTGDIIAAETTDGTFALAKPIPANRPKTLQIPGYPEHYELRGEKLVAVTDSGDCTLGESQTIEKAPSGSPADMIAATVKKSKKKK